MRNLKKEHLFLILIVFAASLTVFAQAVFRRICRVFLRELRKRSITFKRRCIRPSPCRDAETRSAQADTITEITAEIENDTDKTDDRTTDAWVNYSSDGGATWNQAVMRGWVNPKYGKRNCPRIPPTRKLYTEFAPRTHPRISWLKRPAW